MSAFDMGEAVRPSGLIKTARWTLLLAGVVYGYKRYVNALIQVHVYIHFIILHRYKEFTCRILVFIPLFISDITPS